MARSKDSVRPTSISKIQAMIINQLIVKKRKKESNLVIYIYKVKKNGSISFSKPCVMKIVWFSHCFI